jgi:PhzF family phenazine biosynthesis protein
MHNQSRTYEIYIVDAFTSVRFAGNPAGVCYLTKPNELSEPQMKSIAKEMNLSETAFFYAIDEQAGVYSLRWFTPTTEVKLCGTISFGLSRLC